MTLYEILSISLSVITIVVGLFGDLINAKK